MEYGGYGYGDMDTSQNTKHKKHIPSSIRKGTPPNQRPERNTEVVLEVMGAAGGWRGLPVYSLPVLFLCICYLLSVYVVNYVVCFVVVVV